MVNDEAKSSDVFSVFPRFLDTPGLIEQDFRLLFGEATANKFLEKWPTTFKAKVIKESHGLVFHHRTLGFDAHNAESAAEVENGWDSDMSAILLLATFATTICTRLEPVCSSILTTSPKAVQPYLLAQGSTQSSIHFLLHCG
ncbi:hypothetical protein J4Q44_G00083420 [Coregonus suidteri]|uniref:Uncharacterized protein n=1 Tax=Coregonus suidteri TaxID=861788 RepID=A0AAN8R1X1_9TELE